MTFINRKIEKLIEVSKETDMVFSDFIETKEFKNIFLCKTITGDNKLLRIHFLENLDDCFLEIIAGNKEINLRKISFNDLQSWIEIDVFYSMFPKEKKQALSKKIQQLKKTNNEYFCFGYRDLFFSVRGSQVFVNGYRKLTSILDNVVNNDKIKMNDGIITLNDCQVG